MKLNKWLGSDKPKKDDFNYDNQKIDEACGLLAQSVEQLEIEKQRIDATCESLSQNVEQLEYEQQNSAGSQELEAHTSDAVVHITSAERNLWTDSSGLVVVYYTGNGELSRTVSIGFKPRLAIIYPSDGVVAGFSTVSEQVQVYCGFAHQYGCSRGIAINSSGLDVTNSAMGGIDGSTLRYNENGVRYVVIAWKTL